MRFDTQAFLSLSLSTRAEIFCEMIARFFFPVDFLQGLYRDSPRTKKKHTFAKKENIDRSHKLTLANPTSLTMDK